MSCSKLIIFVSFSIEKIKIPALTVSHYSHITSCTPTKSNLYLANLLYATVSEPALYRLLTFQVPNLMSLSLRLGRTEVSVQARGTCICFVSMSVFFGTLPKTQAGVPPLVGCRRLLIHIFTATLHIEGRSSIRSLRTHHAVVTGTHLLRASWMLGRYFMWPVSFVTFCRSCVRVGRRPCARDVLYCWAERAIMFCWCQPRLLSPLLNSAIIGFKVLTAVLLSSGMLCCVVGWIVSDVSSGNCVFFVRMKLSKGSDLDCWTVKIKVLRSFETSGIILPNDRK